jgi:hypothetical protein
VDACSDVLPVDGEVGCLAGPEHEGRQQHHGSDDGGSAAVWVCSVEPLEVVAADPGRNGPGGLAGQLGVEGVADESVAAGQLLADPQRGPQEAGDVPVAA